MSTTDDNDGDHMRVEKPSIAVVLDESSSASPPPPAPPARPSREQATNGSTKPDRKKRRSASRGRAASRDESVASAASASSLKSNPLPSTPNGVLPKDAKKKQKTGVNGNTVVQDVARKDVAEPATTTAAAGTAAVVANGATTASSTTSPPPTPAAPTKRPPVLDVAVHRLRHLKYQPQAIVCLAATSASVVQQQTLSSSSSSPGSFLAVARQDGTVELRAVHEKYRAVATIPGIRNQPVHRMAWTHNNSNNDDHPLPVLVGATLDGSLFVLDFTSASRRALMSSGGGAVLSLAALAPPSNQSSPALPCRSTMCIAASV